MFAFLISNSIPEYRIQNHRYMLPRGFALLTQLDSNRSPITISSQNQFSSTYHNGVQSILQIEGILVLLQVVLMIVDEVVVADGRGDQTSGLEPLPCSRLDLPRLPLHARFALLLRWVHGLVVRVAF